jgi:arginyl-tRNA synthetase
VLRKAAFDFEKDEVTIEMSAIEKELVKFIYDFDAVVEEAGSAFNPALVANYIYEVTKLYNRFYHDCPILKEEDTNIKIFRLQLSKLCAQAIANAMNLLGIVVPEKM